MRFDIVTGAGGFIGQRLMRHLRVAGRNSYGWTRNDGDLRDFNAVRYLLNELRPRRVFHLASSPPNEFDDWMRIENEQLMVSNLVHAMPQDCTFIYAGSMAEIGRSGIHHESCRCMPNTPYGCAKLSGTSLAIALGDNLRRDIRVARLFGVYGPGENSNRLLPTIISRLDSGLVVPLSDGEQIRDFIHVDDVCAALMGLADADLGRARRLVNIGTGVGLRVKDVCIVIAKILKADPALLMFGTLPRREVDQDMLVANTDFLGTILPIPRQRWSNLDSAQQIIEEVTIGLGRW